MNKMPVKLKNKLLAYDKAMRKASALQDEVEALFGKYGIDTNCLRGIDEDGGAVTEALTYIEYSEGYVEDNINEIEEVFLWHINNKKLSD